MKKQFFAAAMILALGAGFTACSNDDLGKQEGKEVAKSASTYMTVTFEMPRVNSTRATATDGQDKPSPDFHNVGTWSGQDKVTSFTLYVFAGNTTTSKLEVVKNYSAGSFTTPTVSGKVVVKPNDAFLVQPGQKRVFVVINPTTQVTTHLPATEGSTTLAQFEAKYKDDEFAPTTTAPLATHVAATTTDAAYDKILMTGASADQNIANNISATDAISGAANNVSLTVQRAVAGVTVTSKLATYKIQGMNPDNHTLENDFVEISDLSFVVGQTNKKLYLQQKANTPATTGAAVASAFKTPAYDYIPTGTTVTSPVVYNTTASTYFDYSGLSKTTTGSTRKTSGLAVEQLTNHVLTDITTNLPKVEFLLPTTHNYDASRENSGYRKGNTPYVLVRGYLTPKKYIDANGDPQSIRSLPANANLFYGKTSGLFYQVQGTSQDAAKKGVVGQDVQMFKERVVLYWAWLNPDANNINSPVIRNNIYHIQITAIGNLGGDWNPLVPGSENNPNPKPGTGDNPNEPNTPPVKPEDPLTLDKTWMSANVAILPWQVHSTEVTLSI